jgi:DNA-directed RNA polymerase subunit M/transcription elongation factor TFIIS
MDKERRERTECRICNSVYAFPYKTIDVNSGKPVLKCSKCGYVILNRESDYREAVEQNIQRQRQEEKKEWC